MEGAAVLGSITGYPASLLASLILMGVALVVIGVRVMLRPEYRRSWLANLKRNRGWVVTTIGLIAIAQPGMVEFSDLTLGQQLMFQGSAAAMLACAMVPALIHLRNNHPEVWDEVSESERLDVSSRARWVLARYALVVSLVLVSQSASSPSRSRR